jgi:hypothetical protein
MIFKNYEIKNTDGMRSRKTWSFQKGQQRNIEI